MRERHETRPHRRAIVALVALYALLLQPFLALAAPLAGPVPGLHGVLCAPDGTPLPGGRAAHDHHPCCTAAAAAEPAPPPGEAARAIPLPPVASLRLAGRPEASPPPARPPARANAPRGPPPA